MVNRTKTSILLSFLLIALGTSASAHQGSRSGFGPCPGMYMQFDEHNVSGWSLMNFEERRRYHERMMSSQNFDDCLMIQKEHYSQMQSRAKGKEQNLVYPKQNACELMYERGFFH